MSKNIEHLIDKHTHTSTINAMSMDGRIFIWILDFLLFGSIVSQLVQHYSPSCNFLFRNQIVIRNSLIIETSTSTNRVAVHWPYTMATEQNHFKWIKNRRKMQNNLPPNSNASKTEGKTHFINMQFTWFARMHSIKIVHFQLETVQSFVNYSCKMSC